MTYTLSIFLFGPGGPDPAHWGFTIHSAPNDWGTLLHVRMIDDRLNIFQYEHRNPHVLTDQDAWGLCPLVTLTAAERLKVVTILENEVRVPRGGADNCQNWVVDGLVALEVEGVVADGTTSLWAGRVAGLTSDIKRDVRERWISLHGR
ncbi:hypothetical protein BJY00DRAFT_318020 [Aspergillus carlsbadensis]|nr:hypothetical protein BJY00DRAFT_318020 [Aspergillus carlsbadensis]